MTLIVTLRVPIQPAYPWKAGQRPAEEVVLEAAQSGLWYLDCLGGKVTGTVQEAPDRPVAEPA